MPAASKPEQPGGETDVVGSSEDFGHPPNCQGRLSHPLGVTGCLRGFSPHAQCMGTLTANKRPRWGATLFCSREYPGVVEPLYINTSHIVTTGVFLQIQHSVGCSHIFIKCTLGRNAVILGPARNLGHPPQKKNQNYPFFAEGPNKVY